MQLIQKVSRAFLKLKVGLKPQFGTDVVAGLNSIPAPGVPGLPYPIPVLQTANAKLISTSTEAATGSHAGVSARNTAEKDWNVKFGATADAVNDWAAGDVEKMQRTGFVPTKAETTPAPELEAPIITEKHVGNAIVTITAGQPANGHADAFVFIAAPAAATISRNGDTFCINVGGQQVYVLVSTHPAGDLEGLTPNIPVQVVMAAVNSAGTSNNSEIVSATPQGS